MWANSWCLRCNGGRLVLNSRCKEQSAVLEYRTRCVRRWYVGVNWSTVAREGFTTNDRYAWTVGFGIFLPDRSSNYQQTDSRKSAKKLFGSWKSLHVQVELYFSGIFERHGLVSFVEQGDNSSQKPCERSGSWREHGRNGNDLFKLDRAATASFGRKGHVRRTYSVCGFFDVQSIRWRLDFETCFTRQILEIPTDWPKKVCDKNCPILGKAYMFKERLS